MEYIFLDIDGVLNYKDYLLFHRDDDFIIDEINVRRLQRLVFETNARIVLSSSWRYGFEKNEEDGKIHFNPLYPKGGCAKLERLLAKYHLYIYDVTPKDNPDWDEGNRGSQIQRYIEKNLSSSDHYVIFDDEDWVTLDNPGLTRFGECFFQTDFFENGLSNKDVDMAIKILNRK